MHMTATLTKWYDEHGRHEIWAGNKDVPLPTLEHSLKLNAEAVAAGEQQDLVLAGVARNAREEKLAARAQEKHHNGDGEYHKQMADLYRQHVLKEQPTIQIQGVNRKKPAQPTA
jgi:hypothetical protein